MKSSIHAHCRQLLQHDFYASTHNALNNSGFTNLHNTIPNTSSVYQTQHGSYTNPGAFELFNNNKQL